MKKDFWQQLEKPFFVLAPMDNVTDTAFRQIIASCAAPDVFFTEFTNTDGLMSVGRESTMKRLLFTEKERPLVAQIWGTKPKHYFESAQLLVDMGFDGIDINMGCPDRAIVAKGSCSGLINTPQLAKEIIQATKEGAGKVPVSVKTRIGYKKIDIKGWIGFLLEQDLVALTIHGRTTAEMSKVPAHWDEIGRVVKLRDQMRKETLIIGNGDVVSHDDGVQKAAEYGVDGIMIGRGVFQDPFIFAPRAKTVSAKQKLQLLFDHISLYDRTWHGDKPFEVMKKYYKIYTSGMVDATTFRLQLMALRTPEETLACIKEKIETLR